MVSWFARASAPSLERLQIWLSTSFESLSLFIFFTVLNNWWSLMWTCCWKMISILCQWNDGKSLTISQNQFIISNASTFYTNIRYKCKLNLIDSRNKQFASFVNRTLRAMNRPNVKIKFANKLLIGDLWYFHISISQSTQCSWLQKNLNIFQERGDYSLWPLWTIFIKLLPFSFYRICINCVMRKNMLISLGSFTSK